MYFEDTRSSFQHIPRAHSIREDRASFYNVGPVTAYHRGSLSSLPTQGAHPHAISAARDPYDGSGINKQEAEMKDNCCGYVLLASSKYEDVPQEDLPYKAIHSGMVEYTTSHGIPHVAVRSGLPKKLFWTLISLAALGFMGYHLYSIIASYLSYSTTINVNIVNEPKLLFPSVTVCNMNSYRLSMININSDLRSKLEANGTGLDDHRQPQSGLGSKKDNVKLAEQFKETISAYNSSVLETLGHQIEDFILDCEYEGYRCYRSKFYKFIDPFYGNCFVFNSGWNNTPTSDLYTSSNSGPDYGLKLVFNIEQNEYLGPMTSKAGVRVVVHPQTSMPFPEDTGISISPGLSTSIGLRKYGIMTEERIIREIRIDEAAGRGNLDSQMMCFEVSLARLDGNYGDCQDATVRNFDVNVYEEQYPGVNYTYEACVKTCYQKAVIIQCKCFDTRFPSRGQAFQNVEVPPCRSQNQEEADCLDGVSKQYQNGTIKCDCLNPCKISFFDITVSSVLWPADHYKDTLFKDLEAASPKAKNVINNNGTEYARNFAQLEVYYEELNLEELSEQASYEDGQFWSDLGGSVGLWVGASVITLFEFFEYFCDLLVLCCLRSRKSSERRTHPRSSSRRSQKQDNVRRMTDSSLSIRTTDNYKGPNGMRQSSLDAPYGYS